jgi:hypothetical protein
LDDKVCKTFLEVIYLESKLMKANGIIVGIPPHKIIPIAMTRLKYEYST